MLHDIEQWIFYSLIWNPNSPVLSKLKPTKYKLQFDSQFWPSYPEFDQADIFYCQISLELKVVVIVSLN